MDERSAPAGLRTLPRPWAPRAAGLLALTFLLAGVGGQAAESPSPGEIPPRPDANRLTYLDGEDPFHVGLHFPKLTTPQWVGEPGVDVVVTLGIDDMRESEKYETFLRPILNRLKQIDGRAALSIFCNAVTPEDPRLAGWLKGGLSLEVHTLSHPCPILSKGDFEGAWNTFHGGVSLLSSVPGNEPVAFRTPCCDSINSPSPRVYAELFRGTDDQGRFLRMDSSVVMLLTAEDPALPKSLVTDPDGTSRFSKYVPFKSFVTTVRDYPYPWVIAGRCWEFPCLAPSDWEGQNILGKNHPTMLADWKAALDAIALKQGTFNSVFHPHGWSTSAQWVELIDHAVATLGNRVRFLNYREAHERLARNLTVGEPLRAADGGDNGVRLIDLDGDGYLDVIVANERVQRTRLWNPGTRSWRETEFPVRLVRRTSAGRSVDAGARFGIVHGDGRVSMLVRDETSAGAWTFDGTRWISEPALLAGLEVDGSPVQTTRAGLDRGLRFRDVDGDGSCEALIGNPEQQAILHWDEQQSRWVPSEWHFPPGVTLVNAQGQDNGVRFADVNEDGSDDLVMSNEERYGTWLYQREAYLGWGRGWTRKTFAGERPKSPPNGKPAWVETPAEELPPFVRPGPHRNNGAWFHSRHLWVQNENTAHLPDLVERRSFDDLMRGALPSPRSPQEALAAFRVAAGFHVELVATEPLVTDPVAIDWDARGRLWVAEMRDYPLGLDGRGQPGGAVRCLTDADGDGTFDQSKEFLTGVRFPNGVMPWRQGVLVSAAPEVFYAEDTDGDGRADVRRVILTGFVEGNQQHRVNGFALGLDGWVYGANGDSGGDIHSPQTGKTASLRGRDFRFRPDTGEFETIEGQTQFGRFRDDWGHWFGNANYTWLWHYPWPAQALARNPQLILRDPRILLTDAPGRNRVFPISRALPRPNQVGDENTVTSACGASAYRDDLFGPEYASSIFIAEPTENVVHREVLRPQGAGLASDPGPGGANPEFLASTDNWFRPVQTRTGPDGALYIVDMYRLVIEHPEWIPPDLKSRMNLRAGEDRGRIYRVVPDGKKPSTWPRLDGRTPEDWVEALKHPNGWVRDTAMRLLLETTAPIPEDALRVVARSAADPRARVQALATLTARGLVNAADIQSGLGSSHPGIQSQALRSAESLLTGAPDGKASEELATLVATFAGRCLPGSAAATANALGALSSPSAATALIRLAQRFPGDRVLETAVLGASFRHAPAMVRALGAKPDVSARMLGALLGYAAQSPDAVQECLDALLRWQADQEESMVAFSAASLLDSLQRQGRLTPEVAVRLRPILARALATALRSGTAEGVRRDALRALEFAGGSLSGDLLRVADLLAPSESLGLQRAALRVLDRCGLPGSTEAMLKRWPGLSPDLRAVAMDALLATPANTARLLDALESGLLAPREVPLSCRSRLLAHPDPAVRGRAEKQLGTTRSQRDAVLKEYAAATRGSGDPSRGEALFKEHCAACHRLQGLGADVGPDLGVSLDKSPAALLIAILDPNQAFEERYTGYTAVTRRGREFSGVIASESPTSVTLKNAAGVEETLLRSELAELRSSGRSLMPEGFELSLEPSAVADLIAYVGTQAPQPREFAGNRPQVISPGAAGDLRLTAARAEVHGPTLVFESGHTNLGYWQSPNDRAVWQLESRAAGLFDVWILGAAPASPSTNRLILEVAGQVLEDAIPQTGSWETYRPFRLGSLKLDAGRQRLVARGRNPLVGAILDLREIRLVPAGAGSPPDFATPGE